MTAPAPAKVWVAPPGWRAIDFISDLHLCDAMPLTFGAWAAYMDTSSADAVVVLGDLFQLWVGDDMRQRPFESAVLDVLRRRSSVGQVLLMVGNRDFLIGAEALRCAGVDPLPDPSVLVAWERRILLTHGDALCLADTAYQAFRREVRSAGWQRQFLARPLEERLAIATEIRRRSDERRRFDGDANADLDATACHEWLRANAADAMIHGHTHRPDSPALGMGIERTVLGDWDLDDAQQPRAQVLRLSASGLRRIGPSEAAGR